MRFYRPHSFFSLLLIGFIFVCIPLLAALYSSMQTLEGLVEKSVEAVHDSVDRVNRSREVVELIHDQERMARLFDVLGETSHLQGVNSTHQKIVNSLEYLLQYADSDSLSWLIKKLRTKENYIVTVLNRFSGDPEQLKKEKQNVLGMYQDAGTMATAMVKLTNQLMIGEAKSLRLKVEQDKRRLAWQTYGLICFTVFSCAVFISLIFKPVRQIDKGIENLGEGDFNTPISVTGPRDLEKLGMKLNWLRKRLAQLDKEKVKMVAHISHDLKTPLASIKEGTGLLQDGIVGPMNDQQMDIVEILDKNCIKLQALIEDILNYNMAQAQDVSLQKKNVQLDQLIEEVIADHRNSILARNIKLEVQLVSVTIYGNLKQMKTVFDNLISNAVKFTPDQGSIRIILQADAKIAACLVEDSGSGINEEERAQVFSPFFKGNRTEKSIIKGSGLGLAISKEYLMNHGGSIRLLPSSGGARFVVTLPLTEWNEK